MRILKASLFLIAVLCMVELSFRVYLYGPAALNPARMDSFVEIHHSDLVRPADFPGVYYELKPSVNAWYKGARFITNAAGLRDNEYSLRKPANTFRIAVLGSSWSMGSGVGIDEAWHSQLEAKLNAESTGLNYEIINFAVDQYGLGEIVATLESKVPAFEPDLVVIALTYYTPTILWPDPAEPYTVLPKRHPFLDLHSLRVMDYRLKLGVFLPDASLRTRITDDERLITQLENAAEYMVSFREKYGTPIVIAKLGYRRSNWTQNNSSNISNPLVESPELVYIDISDTVGNAGYSDEQLMISIWDTHPNKFAHKLVADAVEDELIAKGLLPVSHNQQ